MKESTKLLDYGAIGLIAFIFLAALVAVVLYLKNQNEKILKEKNDEIQQLRKELNALRDKVENRLGDLLDSCGDSINQNSIALHENSSVFKRVEGVLLLIAELMKNRN